MHMTAQPNPELIDLLESLISDGELSVDEVYQLSEWLNENPGACDEWPGEMLVAPLQEAWADGKVGKMELRGVAKIIGRILKEVARQRREAERRAADSAVREMVESAAARFDRMKPSTPSLAVSLSIKSDSDRTTLYTVDLTDPSCSCPDWMGRRSNEPRLALSRCCKHILKAFLVIQPESLWEDWFQSFCLNGVPMRPGTRAFVVPVRSGLALVMESKPPWCNVLAPETDAEHGYHGYHLTERRWSYDEEPVDEAEIRRWIHKLL